MVIYCPLKILDLFNLESIQHYILHTIVGECETTRDVYLLNNIII